MYKKTPVGDINIPEPIIVPIIIPTPLNNVILRFKTTLPSLAWDSSPIPQKNQSLTPVNATHVGKIHAPTTLETRYQTRAPGDSPPRNISHDWITFCYHFYDLRNWNRRCDADVSRSLLRTRSADHSEQSPQRMCGALLAEHHARYWNCAVQDRDATIVLCAHGTETENPTVRDELVAGRKIKIVVNFDSYFDCWMCTISHGDKIIAFIFLFTSHTSLYYFALTSATSAWRYFIKKLHHVPGRLLLTIPTLPERWHFLLMPRIFTSNVYWNHYLIKRACSA